MRKESKRDVTPVISIRGYRRGVVAYLFFSGTPTAYYQHLSFQPCAFFFTTTRPRGANGQQKNYLIMKKVLFALVAMSLLFTACEDGNDDFIKLKEVDDVCTMMDDLKLMEHCYEEYDVNKDGKVSMDEAAAVREFETWSYDISSIKGIEYFTNLEYLLCPNAELRAVDIDLNNNKKLRTVKLNFSADAFLDLSTKISINCGNNTVLKELRLSDCNLNDLDLSEYVSLTYVSLDNVAIENLNLANGNEITLNLVEGWSDYRKSDCPILTIWFKKGQAFDIYDDDGYYHHSVKYNYTVKYID